MTKNPGYTKAWHEWDGISSGQHFGTCVLQGEGKTYQDCINEEGATWVTGYNFLEEKLNSKAECDEGWCCDNTGVIYGVGHDECDSFVCSTCKTGREPWCYDEELCKTTKSCTSISGCLRSAKWNTMTNRADEQGVQTPLGFISPFVTKEDCDLSLDYNEAWLEPLMTEDECFDFLMMCKGGSDPDARVSTGLPTGYTYRNEEDCKACNGTLESFWKWETGMWSVERQFRKTAQWKQVPETIIKPVWEKRLDPAKWKSLVTLGRYARYSVIFTSQVLCLYGAEKDALSHISCGCTESNSSCYSELETLKGQNIGYFGVCRNSPINQTVSSAVDITSTEDFFVSDQQSSCVAFELEVVPLSQFDYNTRRHLTNLAIYSETSFAQAKSVFIYNDHGTVVGQIMGSGFTINSHLSGNITGLKSCKSYLPTSSDWKLRMDASVWDTAYSKYPFKEFSLVKRHDLEDNCISISSANYTYFPVGLVEDYENLEIRHTWKSEELGLIIFIAVMYMCLMLWLLYSFVGRVVLISKNLHDGLNVPVGVGCILFQSILRSIYFLGVPTGVFDYEYLAILFSDLPQLLFHAAVVTTGVLWYQIVAQAQGKSKYSRFTIIAFLYVVSLFTFFAALNIAAGATRGDVDNDFTCASTEEERGRLTITDELLFSYKGIFAFYTILIAVTFGIQSLRIVALLRTSASSTEGTTDTIQKKRDTMGKLAIEFAVTSILSVIGLLVQAAVCIYTAVDDLSNTEKMSIIITCELLPTYGLAYLFRFVTPWTAAKKWMKTTSATKTPRSRTGRTTSSSSVLAELEVEEV
eukprot:TRINITY_DN4333_c1_g1_i8.p1 TRINITY_DN4333_c1_g1~~TRINITY_DN4333_c1_g1_i8.p1  ORF type:complete len:808 (-),score=128.21 TRINITY_DN4333_c1_g1_i8:140-2563(-)